MAHNGASVEHYGSSVEYQESSVEKRNSSVEKRNPSVEKRISLMLKDGNSVMQADRSGEQPDLFVKKKIYKNIQDRYSVECFFK